MADGGIRKRIRAVPPPPGGVMVGKVRESLDALVLEPEDAGLAALAVQYADAIDNAVTLAEELAAVPYDPDTVATVQRLRQRVEAHQVVVDVGPRLLAALTALGATPAARSAAGGKGTTPRSPAADALAAMRGGA